MRFPFVILLSLFLSVTVFLPTAYAIIAGGCGGICGQGISTTGTDNIIPYLWRQGLIVLVFYIFGYFFGRLVQKRKMATSTSRKIVCVATFSMSYANSLFMPVLNSVATLILVLYGTAIILMMLATLVPALRRRSAVLATVFSAINRPEDEPHTLLWLSTEAIVTSLVVIAFVPIIGMVTQGMIINQRALTSALLIPIFASGIGDALAEVVGKKWGKHHYTTQALFTKKSYTRTLEGSAMIFLTTLVVGTILAAVSAFSMPLFYWKAFLILPITLTLAEAKAPHTWDNPFMYFIGYGTIILCLLV